LQSLAATLGVDFYFSEPEATPGSTGLFSAEYRVPLELRKRMSGTRVALVDDVISAGSSVRATAKAVSGAGASIVVVGTFLTLGTVALDHFAGLEIPVEALERRDLSLWSPEACPLCQAGAPLQDGGEA
jgi:orotate phosphoribosyltransferase